ncbi:MAG: class I adenylate-forming enzyme family protein [Firmicutes bacterium]|nr:class I adenylate-forming enzyme family protein [Bacillota bacterium]
MTVVHPSDYTVHYQGPYQDMLKPLTMTDVFDAAVRQHPDAVAVFSEEGAMTWRDWQEEAEALAQGLANEGVRPGDVVGVYLPNSREFLVSHVALSYLGAVMLPLHLAHGQREVEALLSRSGARALILPRAHRRYDLADWGRILREAVPSLEIAVWAGDAPAGEIALNDLLNRYRGQAWPRFPVKPSDPFLLCASSGTTATRPKICMHTHQGLLSNAWQTAVDGKSRATDVMLSASPFSHAFGFLSIHVSILLAHPQVLLPHWDVATCRRLLETRGVTVLFLVPAQVMDLLHAVKEEPLHGHALREIRTGGAAVPREVVTQIRQHLQAKTIVQWGMSEVGAGCYTDPDDDPDVVSQTIGRPVSGAEVMIVGHDGQRLGPGQVGQLCYRSPYMFRGYYGDGELTRQAVNQEGWLLTGDLAEMNPDGTISYRGRMTETINRGGLKFSALEVESLLTDMPSLRQAAIMARPDERLGERAVLVAALRAGHHVTLEAIREHLLAKGLAKYKCPEDLIVVDELPTTPTGKIARGRLKEVLEVHQRS